MRNLLLAMIPLLLGLLVLLRWSDGTLIYYVAQRYSLLVVAGALFLVILGVMAPFFRHTLEHVKSIVRPWQIAILLFAITLGFVVPPAPLSAQTALQRGVGLQLPTSLTPKPFYFAVDSSKRSFGDWALILFSQGDKDVFVGQEANISGFITQDGDKTYLTRFQVSCCAADGRPMGILLNPSQVVENNTWWEISGKMQLNESNEIYLEAEKMKPIEIPRNPYL